MITTVTLNPCIDKMVTVSKFVYGGLNRVQKVRLDAAGKGINVAVAFHQLGGEAVCTGINYTEKGDLIEKLLDGKGIPHDFVKVAGEVRTNLKIFDSSAEVVTEINESGYPVSAYDLEKVKAKVTRYARKSSTVVFSGSVPKGVPDYIYRHLIEAVRDFPVRIVLDAEGSLLSEGLKARPYLVKPNLYELERAVGRNMATPAEVVRGARKLIEQGACVVAVSMGKDGAIIVDDKDAYYSPAIPVEVKGTAGAGDSMVAAFCLAMELGLGLEDMLLYGVAAATASVMREGTQLCTRSDFEVMLKKASIKRI